jgi:hypothetical protein
MYISPSYEGASIDTAPVSAVEIPEYDEDPSEIGDFAQILAGLLHNAEVENTPDENTADNELLAATNEIPSTYDGNPEIFPVAEQVFSLFSEQAAQNVLSAEETVLFDSNQNFTVSADLFSDQAETPEINPENTMAAEFHIEEDAGDSAAIAAVSATDIAAFAPPDAELSAVSGQAAPVASAEVLPKEEAEKNAGKGKFQAGDDVRPLEFFDRAETAEQTPPAAEGKKGRLEEVRGKERRQERFTIDVRDYRSGQADSADVRVTAGAELKADRETGTRELTLELRLPDQRPSAPAVDVNWGTKSAYALEDLLARELHQNFNNDIVRHASMILRDEGKGIIRLALKPETLGHVKICLEMAENKITGHIVVESEEALRAFDREIHSLEQAFKESGFQEAYLETSLASDGGGAEQFRNGAHARALVSGLDAASRYDTWSQAETSFDRTLERGLINILA